MRKRSEPPDVVCYEREQGAPCASASKRGAGRDPVGLAAAPFSVFVAAEVTRLTLNPEKVGASSRRLLREGWAEHSKLVSRRALASPFSMQPERWPRPPRPSGVRTLATGPCPGWRPRPGWPPCFLALFLFAALLVGAACFAAPQPASHPSSHGDWRASATHHVGGTLAGADGWIHTASPDSEDQFALNPGSRRLRAHYLNPTTGRFWSMDSFEGNASDPLSLHKYLYAHADPVNQIDPSGHESQKATMGKQVHKKLGETFTGNGTIPLRFSGPSIATIGGRLNLPIPEKIEVLFPDLLDATRKEVYEIKPLTPYGLATGFFQALGYVSLLNRIDPSGGWHLGNTWSPPSFLILPPTSGSAGGVAYISPPVGGVIFYEAVTIQQIAKRGHRTVRSSQQNQLQQQMGIATILSTMGGF